MLRESENALVEVDNEQWVDDLEVAMPESIVEGKDRGQLPENARHIKIQLGITELPDGSEVKFTALLTDSLLEVFQRGAQELGKKLLPPNSNKPLDILRFRERGHQGWSAPITNLDQPLWLALAHGYTRHFGIEYVLAVKVNTKWGIAPAVNSTPRQLLESFGFDPAQFSLYRADSANPLPPDTPLMIKRGDMFEAQKDGRYGSSVKSQRPRRGTQSIEDDVATLQQAGVNARLFMQNGQKYVEVRDLIVPSPPWSRPQVNIAIAIPATYPAGGLDAFYLELTVSHSSGAIPRQQSIANLDNRSWGLISWHYTGNRPWNPMHDDLESHIEHCRGAMLCRGVSQ